VGVERAAQDDAAGLTEIGLALMVRIDPRLPFSMFAPMRRATRATSHRRAAVEGLLEPGTILDKYRIDELVGTGGFGAVYRATHLLLQTTVAIKHLRADVLAKDPRVVAQLLDEARWAARIQHPNVVRVFDVTQSPSLTYVVMEYIEGKTLAEVIDERGELPPDEVARIGLDVAAGLAAGLACGLIHRDIKPANIVLSRGGPARIVDLGLARAGADEEPTSTASATRPKGGMVGTRGYAAPEQLTDAPRADHRADVYSLGVTLEEALHGRRRQGRPTSSQGTSTLSRILTRMIAREPSERPSYETIIEELSSARGSP
jgi:eukaryotic-like serine/threonine-protein kinase